MSSKIKTLQELQKIIKELKSDGKKIVLCHGVFDLLHLGHIKHFNEARTFGDILIVTVTPDSFVTQTVGVGSTSVGRVIAYEQITGVLKLWQDRWREICTSDKMSNIQLVISIQPYLGVGNKDFSDWEMLMKKTNKKTDVSEFYPVIISELENIDSDCAKTLDLTNVFDVYTDTIFYDLIHVVDFGNKIVADRIYEEIIPILENKFK